MTYQRLIALAVASALWQGAQADASYEETVQITGGSMKDTFALAGQFSPSAASSMSKANSTITVVQGNRMARIATSGTMVFDLDQGTVTRIDNQKKQYMVTTFEGLQQMVQRIQQLMAAHPGQAGSTPDLPKELASMPATFDVKAEETGARKTIAGTAAHQVLLTENMTFHSQDPGSNDSVTYYYRNDVWLADADPPGWSEIQDFRKRMAARMAIEPGAVTNPMSLLTATRPGLAEGLKKIGEEAKKQRGVAVMVVQQLGGHGEGDSVASAANSASGSPASSSTSEVTSTAASEAAQQQAARSKFGALGSSLASAASSAFQHHSQGAPPAASAPAATATSQAPAAATDPASPAGKPASVDKLLYEQTTVTSNFSTEKIPASAFEIPAGYTKVSWPGPPPAPH